MCYKILMVDDDSRFTSLVSDYFIKNGINMICANSEAEARRLFLEHSFDLALLDIMMPSSINAGYDLCEWIRYRNSDIPVIFLSARGDARDQVMGFELGAHDYVVKPYSERVLLLKVKLMLERQRGHLHSGATQELHGVFINRDTHETRIDGQSVSLTPKLFSLLSVLMESAGHVMSREQLLDSVWGYDFFGDSRVVDTHISKLKKVLGERAYIIKTVTGFGYIFRGSD